MKPVLLALTLLMLSALAGTSAVSATIDQQNTSFTANGERCSLIPGNNQWCGQTFTARLSGQLPRIDLNLFCSNCVDGTGKPVAPPPIVVSVRATSGGLPTGSDLASTTLVITNYYPTTQTWYSANFATPTSVTSGTQYAIVIRPQTSLAMGAVGLSDTAVNSFTGNDVYAGGAVVFSTNSGSSWAIETGPKPSVDGAFITYVGSGGGGGSSADLSISNSDGATTATPGTPVTYTITASNSVGSSSVTGATVTDTFPTTLNSCTWTCSGAGGGTCGAASGSGNINSSVNLPAGGSVTYSATCTIASSATGSLSNTASVAVPAGVTDPTPGNNSATDTDTLTGAQADLSITNNDGVTSAAPGGSVTYAITASNAGPSGVTGAVVHDSFSSGLTCNWTCAGAGGGTCPAPSGSGNLNHSVNLPVGASTTFTATCAIATTVAPGGTLSNTASVSAPTGVTDPASGNNSATDNDTLAAQADLSITNDDGVTSAPPGGSVTYTIKASNLGPDFVGGAVVHDSFSSGLTCNWTCAGTGGGTCPAASGSGNLNYAVNLPVGASTTFTTTCAIATTVTPGGTLSNTASISVPAGVTDPAPGNNSATATFTLAANADLAITNSDGVTTAIPGQSVTYTIKASNLGPDFVGGAVVHDSFSSGLTCNWTCAGAGGGTCPAASGSGNLNYAVNLPVGANTTFTATCAIATTVTGGGTLSNTASVTAPTGVTDPVSGNNSVTDTDSLEVKADVRLTVTDNVDAVRIGDVVTYVINITNTGPSNANVNVNDALPAQLSNGSWVCTGTGGAICTKASGNNNTINTSAAVPVGGQAQYVYTATVSNDDSMDKFTNTATATLSSGTDPNPNNNSASDTDQIVLFLDGFDGGQTLAMNVATAGGGGSFFTAQLGVDAGLLNSLGSEPVTIASGRAANGKSLFSVQLIRLGTDVAMRTLTRAGDGIFSDVSPWHTLDLKPHVLILDWQSASARGHDGYLNVEASGSQMLVVGRDATDSVTQLQIAVESNIPWLVPIAQ